jgi:hypothetical protein
MAHTLGPLPRAVDQEDSDESGLSEERIPRPTLQFRRRAWREFQRALDPLAPPKPLKLPPQRN